MIRHTFHLGPDQVERLRESAERSGVTVAEILRRAVELYLDRDERAAERDQAKGQRFLSEGDR